MSSWFVNLRHSIAARFAHGTPYKNGPVAEVLRTLELTYGTGANQVNRGHQSTHEISSGGDTDLDLTTLTEPDGTAMGLEKVVILDIENDADSAGNLVIGPSSSNGWTGLLGGTTPTITLPPGGWISVAVPSATALAVSSSNKALNLAASSGDVTAHVLVNGRDTA